VKAIKKSASVSRDEHWMKLALRLARRGSGSTSPNPMVGAVFVRNNVLLGQGWHRAAGKPHAEVEAIRDAERRGRSLRGATLFVTLEPCSTQGRTPPCTEALTRLPLKRVVIAATDPNPKHAGKAYRKLRRTGFIVETGLLAERAETLNECFNHWIVQQRPFVTVKAAMSLDGKIATAQGESEWITGPEARLEGMRLRREADAILVGVNTILTDDPSLTRRSPSNRRVTPSTLRRIVLDTRARTPINAKIITDEDRHLTTIIVGRGARPDRVSQLRARGVQVRIAPLSRQRISIPWMLRQLGKEQFTNLLVEGGGEVQAAFLLGGFAHRIAFFYAPIIVGGRNAHKAVAGTGARSWDTILSLTRARWKQVGKDWMLTARCGAG